MERATECSEDALDADPVLSSFCSDVKCAFRSQHFVPCIPFQSLSVCRSDHSTALLSPHESAAAHAVHLQEFLVCGRFVAASPLKRSI